ncbi:Cof Predicted hydrolases of the HAD superfamily [actinobacterium SCGC AAA044-D11]
MIPGKRPKLIATDLDGTIVPHLGPISDRTIAAFKRAHEAGIEIFFVTGRPPRWMKEVKEAFGFGNAICANGAILYDLMNERVIEEWLIPKETQLDIVNRLRKNLPGIYFAVEYGDEFHREKKYTTKWDIGLDNIGVDTIEMKIELPAFKMLGRCANNEFTSDQMLEIAARELTGIANITHSNSSESLIEISALGVSKGETLAKMAERAGLTAEDCVTFGDNPNDFSMLEWAARSWAMSDGHPDGPKYAKFVADAHYHDGVAIVIESLLELPA